MMSFSALLGILFPINIRKPKDMSWTISSEIPGNKITSVSKANLGYKQPGRWRRRKWHPSVMSEEAE
jgi:hypothetical protein